jgi:hypothetical protein
MPERCPLAGRGFSMAIEVLPQICMEQCGVKWENTAKMEPAGKYDRFNSTFTDLADNECDHEGTDIEFSHESLQTVDSSPRRIYTVVDLCSGCHLEYGEQSYSFDCPYNDV